LQAFSPSPSRCRARTHPLLSHDVEHDVIVEASKEAAALPPSSSFFRPRPRRRRRRSRPRFSRRYRSVGRGRRTMAATATSSTRAPAAT
jgi:hypothetical protein